MRQGIHRKNKFLRYRLILVEIFRINLFIPRSSFANESPFPKYLLLYRCEVLLFGSRRNLARWLSESNWQLNVWRNTQCLK
uniref:Uncharacterized protein n=1 Tax=Candidatus Kentrum sp. FW TaxID=2126338 RepID=A0A450TA15_9GAMM|nr:MAG: hypothetical protein BECKFW1821C_GA0114237_100430 [Candidatus Kentron sp. FW]